MDDPIRTAPRWFLATLTGALAAAASWQTIRWVEHVEQHINDSSSGYQRIAALEARIQALEAHAAWCRRQHEP